jgi:two-component system OmpR family response regulator
MGKKPSMLLLVEDNDSLRVSITSFLKKEKFIIHSVSDESEMTLFLKDHSPNLIILDVNLPGIGGIDVCTRLRKTLLIPIIVLSDSEDDIDKVLALELGANHYLVKPVNPRVLIAFVKSSLKQAVYISSPEVDIPVLYQVLYFAGFELNCSTHVLKKDNGLIIKLPPAEYSMLNTLSQHPRRVLSRGQLLDMTHDETESFDRCIDTLISRLRKKIEVDPKRPCILKTVRGSGYIFDISVKKKVISHR